MTRVKGVFKPSDYPGVPDEATRSKLRELFDHMFPGVENPEIDPSHGGFAVMAQDPQLALLLHKLGKYVVGEMPWTQRRDLRELAVQTLNLHFQCDYSFEAHFPVAEAEGIDPLLQAAIPYWRRSKLFDEEQRLVIRYTNAVVAGNVPRELFASVVERYGERGAVEFTAAISWWSYWAMFLNATWGSED